MHIPILILSCLVKNEKGVIRVFFYYFYFYKKVSVIKIKLIKLCKIPVNHGLNVIGVILSFLYQSPSFFFLGMNKL